MLYYRNGDKLMAVSFAMKPAVTASSPRMLFEEHYQSTAPGYTSYDIHPDGRFIMIKPVAEASSQQINLVQNWFQELERIVPSQ